MKHLSCKPGLRRVASAQRRGHSRAMHDIRLIRDNPAAFDAALARRGVAPVADALVAVGERRRALIPEAQAGQARRNEASKAIGAAKAQKDEVTASALMAEVAALKERLPAIEAEE